MADLALRIMLQAEDMMSAVITEAEAALVAMAESAAESAASFDVLAASVDAATTSLAGVDTSLASTAVSADETVAGKGGVDASLVSMGESADAVVAGMGGVDASLAEVAASADAVVVGIGGVDVAASEFVVGMGGVTDAASEASAALDATAVSADASKVSLGGVGLAFAAVGIGVAVAGAASVKSAADFQTGMTSLVTGAGEAQSNIKMVSDGILNMAPAVGETTSQLTSGMYQIESDGYHGADGLTVLKDAAEGAKVGNANLTSVANGLTTAMTDYHEPVSQAAAVTNDLIATVANGKTTMDQLSSSLSLAFGQNQTKCGLKQPVEPVHNIFQKKAIKRLLRPIQANFVQTSTLKYPSSIFCSWYKLERYVSGHGDDDRRRGPCKSSSNISPSNYSCPASTLSGGGSGFAIGGSHDPGRCCKNEAVAS